MKAASRNRSSATTQNQISQTPITAAITPTNRGTSTNGIPSRTISGAKLNALAADVSEARPSGRAPLSNLPSLTVGLLTPNFLTTKRGATACLSAPFQGYKNEDPGGKSRGLKPSVLRALSFGLEH